MARSRHTIAVAPGATIREQLEDRGMTQREFASRMGLSEKHVSRLINGEVALTPEVALKLEYVLGVPASYWNNLEAIYREKLVRVQEENQMEADAQIARAFPYLEMSKLGWVPPTRDAYEKANHLRRYFCVASLHFVSDPRVLSIACRRLGTSEKSDYALLAWAQQAKIQAVKHHTSPINIKLLRERIGDIRAMTTANPQIFCGELVDLLADCGIAVIFLPHLSGSFLHGATFYDGNKIVIGMTVRGKDADRFWFSLFHEIGHVLNNDMAKANGTTDEDEEAADIFARDTLIAPDDYECFIASKNKSQESIVAFAKSIGISPGIVVGRLQKDNYLHFNEMNSLKEKYTIS